MQVGIVQSDPFDFLCLIEICTLLTYAHVTHGGWNRPWNAQNTHHALLLSHIHKNCHLWLLCQLVYPSESSIRALFISILHWRWRQGILGNRLVLLTSAERKKTANKSANIRPDRHVLSLSDETVGRGSGWTGTPLVHGHTDVLNLKFCRGRCNDGWATQPTVLL